MSEENPKYLARYAVKQNNPELAWVKTAKAGDDLKDVSDPTLSDIEVPSPRYRHLGSWIEAGDRPATPYKDIVRTKDGKITGGF